MNKSLIIIFVLIIGSQAYSQVKTSNFESNDSSYNANIKKSRLYNVYIPRDIDDALIKLIELTTEEARKPLITVDEEVIAKKLHFGLGRWMEYNWNFSEGSRFSHYLRQIGLSHTEDMTRFMLILFHRHISVRPLNVESLAIKIIDERKAKIKAAQQKLEIIRIEKKEIPNKN